MKLIAGLGNIGEKYASSRHNVGFMAADELSRRWGVAFSREKFAFCGQIYRGGEKIFLIKPTTYMNLSGQALAHYARYFNILPEHIAVIQDDMDLPGGKLRIRQKGSAGGHNGLKSIILELGSADFNRFKIGIGHPITVGEAVLRHVLSAFEPDEAATVKEAVQKTAAAVECWIDDGITQAMNKFNG